MNYHILSRIPEKRAWHLSRTAEKANPSGQAVLDLGARLLQPLAMVYASFANAVVLLHALFILFVVFGGLLVFWKPWLIWIHVPVALYGMLIEWVGWVCPLTPLENWLRHRAGQTGYEGGFVETYLLPLIYPGAFTRDVGIVLGVVVLAINVFIYMGFFLRR